MFPAMTPLRINQLLFPTDFSETAHKALPFALDIAKRSGARLTLMHTIEEPYDFAPMAQEIKQQIRNRIESLFKEQLDDILKNERYKDIEINIEIRNGPATYSILDLAEEMKADLIMMGTTGASGIDKILVGSTTSKVISQSPVPVLAVPKNYEHDFYNGLDSITFLTDYKDEDLEAVRSTSYFAQLYDAKVVVLHIEKELNLRAKIMHEGFRELVSQQISSNSMQFELIIEDDFETGIASYLDAQWSSVLALVRYKKSFFTKLWTKDHTKKLGFYSKLPLLVFIGNDLQ
ncbi:universal stress protein [Fodinibius sediminis]|uniref:Nucleotide-binding universal stress protein, UspA family n=1 Tax=Fodinibius sediminis TaxID=1214077 RepID=A0A521CVF3_9BACT|nr:universal stress protein [Fodinibius sediminis]SMO63426.1 Nucleotide-binding universal stress protein, UspA family [Fodinibius sediminis]